MSNISIELVPRNQESLTNEIDIVNKNYPEITTVNIPDLLRFNIRSYQACGMIRECSKKFIPHIRAIDFDLSPDFRLTEMFSEICIKEILIIRGDEPQGMTKKIYPTTALDLARKIKKEINGIKIYGAIDQYRDNIKGELDYVKMKIDAGFDGFFTQPFFDMRLFEIFAEQLSEYDVYWGISPVTSEQSRLYWETKNNCVFPRDFSVSSEWNIRFAKNMLSVIKQSGMNAYLMPIRINMETYLNGIFK